MPHYTCNEMTRYTCVAGVPYQMAINVHSSGPYLYIIYVIVCVVSHSIHIYIYIRECGSTLYVGMAQGVSFSLYIGIGAKFENTQKTGERRLCTAEYRTVLL